jgi:methylated-DNA-protein-cysteine methyltransferase-like protein
MFKEFYEVVSKIPRGKVMTYGSVARIAGFPRCARQVGFALHRNPDPNTIPCHRVVFADGSLSPAFAFGGHDTQKRLLMAEGVVFLGEKVDMGKHSIN